MSVKQSPGGQVWWLVLVWQPCWRRWTTRWCKNILRGRCLYLYWFEKMDCSLQITFIICFSGRGDRHRWLSLPVPSPLQECDAVANLSDDGNQLQVWPAPIRGFAFSFPNMPLMYLLFKDGSGRGAALVAAVLKGKGEWPLLLNSSSPNCLVDHLNQLWLEHPPNIWEVFKLCQPCPLNHQNTKSRISKENVS